MKILTRYVMKEFSAHVVLGLMLFIFILLMDRVFQIASLIINRGVGILPAFQLIVYSLPTLLVLSMPMAVLAAGIMTFGKMASDGEITVIRTSGNSLKPVALPVFVCVMLIALFMIPFNYSLAPRSQYEFRKLFLSIAMKDPALRLEESTLVEIEPYTLLCLNVDHKKKKLREVIIYKESTESEPAVYITARRGTWINSDLGELTLVLQDGTIRHQQADQPQKMDSISFATYTVAIKPPQKEAKVGKSIETMTAVELKEEIRRLKEKDLPAHKIQTRYYLRGALAGAIPVLMLVGIPLGIRAENKGKTIGIGLSLGIIAVYYFMMVAGIKLSFNNSLAPWLGVWLPNLITGLFGAVVFMRSFYR